MGRGTIDDEERRHRCWLEQIEDDALIWHDKRHHVFFSLLRRLLPQNTVVMHQQPWLFFGAWETESRAGGSLCSRNSLQLRFYLFFLLFPLIGAIAGRKIVLAVSV